MLFALSEEPAEAETRTALTIVGLSASAAAMTALPSVAISTRALRSTITCCAAWTSSWCAGVAERSTSSFVCTAGSRVDLPFGGRRRRRKPDGNGDTGTNAGRHSAPRPRSCRDLDRKTCALPRTLPDGERSAGLFFWGSAGSSGGKKVGDSVEIEKTPCRVVGLFGPITLWKRTRPWCRGRRADTDGARRAGLGIPGGRCPGLGSRPCATVPANRIAARRQRPGSSGSRAAHASVRRQRHEDTAHVGNGGGRRSSPRSSRSSERSMRC